MKFPMTSVALGVAALAALASPLALAQDSGWYAGGNVGRAAVSIDDDRITQGLAGQGLATTSIDDHDRQTAFKVFGGYQFNRSVALEGGYFDLGRFGYSAHTAPTGTLNGNMQLRGLNLDLVGTFPLVGNLSALGRVGVTSTRARDNFSASGAASVPYASSSASQRSTDIKLGAGLAYAFTPSLSMRVELERYRFKDGVGNRGNADVASLGLVYLFGVQPRRVNVAAAPAVVAPPPPPPPAAVVAPPPPPRPAPPPAPTRVSLSADALFDFDRSTIKDTGRVELDKFAAQLRGMQYDSVQVTGNTDRLGGHDYNQKLSERRAQAVREYLVQAGVASAKISARGVDGSNPLTGGQCKGNKPSPALIACLQPDRRVDVEVSGSR
ncbi:outer membrane beta-barrel protein [Ramlibacter sp. PS4R-6]|uniref:outer membrane beta-barrel protein n=1 Tax=Ramlibacter sp. PS4R-6 TaxID=3133438 RepID=UPI0030AD5241